MFSQACVTNSVHGGGVHGGGGACVARKGCIVRGMHGRGRVLQGGVRGRREPLQRTVRILLECILVAFINT